MAEISSSAPSVSAAPPPAKMTSRQRLWKISKRLLRSLVLIYFLVCVGMYFAQTYLIFPGSMQQGTPDTKVEPHDGETLVALKTPSGTPIAGLFGLADLRHHPELKDTPRPTVLYFYGNGECMAYSLGIAETFRAMTYHCMLVDYAGYGMSGGKPSEQGCYDAAEAAYRYVLSRPDVDRKHIIVAGWSLGGAVAIDQAYRHRNDGTICALMTFSAFTSMVDMARAHYPFLPVSLMLKHRFMSIDKVPSLQVPYFLGHGKADDQISYYSQADRLAAAYGNASLLTRYSNPRAGHNDFWDTDLAQLQSAMERFLQQAVK